MSPRDPFAVPQPDALLLAGLLATVAVASQETAGSHRFHCSGPDREVCDESPDLPAVGP